MSSRRSRNPPSFSPRTEEHISLTVTPLARNAARMLPALIPTYRSNSPDFLPETMKSSIAESAPSSYMPPVIPPPPRTSAVLVSTRKA